jgi:hypothetical protein
MRMRTTTAIVTMVTAGLTLGSAMTAAAGKTKAVDIPVTSTLQDADPNGAPYTIQSDGAGPYMNGAAGVTSILMANVLNQLYNGDWELLTGPTRTVLVTLSQENAVPAGNPGYTVPSDPPFWGTGPISGKLMLQCTSINRDMLTMPAGSTMTCPLGVRWDVTKTAYYRLNMSGLSGSPETTPAQITCTAANTAGCREWYVDPIPVVNADGSVSAGTTIARLVYEDTRSTTNLGDFYMRYHFHITRP